MGGPKRQGPLHTFKTSPRNRVPLCTNYHNRVYLFHKSGRVGSSNSKALATTIKGKFWLTSPAEQEHGRWPPNDSHHVLKLAITEMQNGSGQRQITMNNPVTGHSCHAGQLKMTRALAKMARALANSG